MHKMVLLLVAVLAAPAMAIPISEVWFQDDFDSYDGPIEPPPWPPDKWWGIPGQFDLTVESWGPPPNKAVRFRGDTGSDADAEAFTVESFAERSAGRLQILSFTLQSDLFNQGDIGIHLIVQLNESTGGELGRWYGCSGGIRPRWMGMVGPPVDISDGEVHTFAIVYDPATGVTEWLHNDAVQWSAQAEPGKACEGIWVRDLSRGAEDHVYFDDVVLGTPEPAAIMLLGVGGLLLRRKRA